MARRTLSELSQFRQSLIGRRFGQLIILEVIPKKQSGQGFTQVRVRCDCGTNKLARLSNILAGSATSCGRHRSVDLYRHLIGKRFGRLTVISVVAPTQRKRGGHTRALVRCDCGVETRPLMSNLLSGQALSCGDHRGTHGHTKNHEDSPEYRSWGHMIDRCTNPNVKCFRNYGGRGVKICDRWRNSFAAFLADVGPRPSLQHSIDRYPDKNGNYEPGNVRWATRKEQNANTRKNVLLTIGGVTLCLSEWARRSGVHKNTLAYRLKCGMPPEEALAK